MLVRRTKRRKLPWDPGKRLSDLKVARTTLCQMRGEIIINSDLYRATGRCIDAIDDIAEEMTGKRDYFTPLQRY